MCCSYAGANSAISGFDCVQVHDIAVAKTYLFYAYYYFFMLMYQRLVRVFIFVGGGESYFYAT